MKRNAITLAFLALFSANGANANNVEQLEEIQVNASTGKTGSILNGKMNISDQVIDRSSLKARSATLGNALAGELGVHSNPFGGGASKPIIRGQDGVRVKILQNSTDVIDVSSLSPDHVVAADTLLASQVEIVRGANTLLYSTASPAGVVNVVDGRIPNQMPFGAVIPNIEGEALVRYNTASNEIATTAGATLGIGDHLALRVEGLKRKANDYKVPHFQADKPLNYLPGSDNKSTVGTVGLSFIHDKGYLGASYSQRQDKYSIPGHIHCGSNKEHFLSFYGSGRYYLNIYPHLMSDRDYSDNPHTHCKHDHDDPSHDNPLGFQVNHEHDTPWIDMKTKRYDVRGELKQPIRGLDKIKLSLTYADYHHNEKDPGNEQTLSNYKSASRDTTLDKGSASSVFKNRGFNSRLEFFHTPTHYLSGMFGIQYQTQKSSAGEPYLPSYFESAAAFEEAQANNVNRYRPYLLVPNTNKSLSIFGLERLKLDQLTLEAAMRYEQQKTPVHYDKELLDHAYKSLTQDPNRPKVYEIESQETLDKLMAPFRQRALSYAATAAYDVTPENRISFTYSHNERIPSPMELYYHGHHLATSSFEHGNKDLVKEKSNNYELAFRHTGKNLTYKASGYYSDFDNYIFNENVQKEGNLYLRRYNQTTAKFYGLEGELNYQVHPDHTITLFGDVVRGKIGKLSPVVGKLLPTGTKHELTEDADQMRVDEDGYAVPQVIPKGRKFIPNPDYATAASCTTKTAEEWFSINEDSECLTEVNVYKNGTATPGDEDYDKLARPATNAPRVPPIRLGFRWQGYFNENWSASLEYTKMFAQKRVSTSTIAIRPDDRNPKGCKRGDASGCKIDTYNKNNLKMVPRHVTETQTKGYNLVNAGIDYNKVIKNVDYTFSLRANNLLNEQIYIHNSFLPYVPQMGRNFVFAINAKF